MQQTKKPNPFLYTAGFKRYHTYDYALRARFGCKVARISLDAGFSCPNRDGRCGTQGCAFCSGRGSGDFCIDAAVPLAEQYRMQRDALRKKWGDTPTIPYLQAFTNTYAPLERLRAVYEEVLALPGAVGLSIATRADCLPPDVCKYLGELAQRTYLNVELGLQTANDQTARRIGRGHTLDTFLRGYAALQAHGVPTVIHLINGLPGEDVEQMLQSAQLVASLAPYGVKLHVLQLLQGTRLAQAYAVHPFPILSMEEYVDIACRQMELLPPQTVLLRVCSDGLPASLVAPKWQSRKLVVQNEIDKWWIRHDSWQGKLYRMGG